MWVTYAGIAFFCKSTCILHFVGTDGNASVPTHSLVAYAPKNSMIRAIITLSARYPRSR